jgi:hypothetical protein
MNTLAGRPEPSFQFVPELISLGVGSYVVAADLNGDGAIDIVISAAHGTLIFWGYES